MAKNYTFNDLLDIMTTLRGENGCPWDREQTHESLKKYLLEEAYEVVDAIDEGSKEKLYDELGDVLLQVVFHSEVARCNGDFTIDDVINAICRKLVHRHPHVFGEAEALEQAGQVEQKWKEIKKVEKGQTTYTQGLEDVPRHMAALMRSYKVQKKAADVGFDWDDVDDAMKKVYEELDELKEVYRSDNSDRISEEMGDLIFAVVNVARFLKVEPETALNATTRKFINRFSYIEENAHKYNKTLEEMNLQEMDKLWEESKKIFK